MEPLTFTPIGVIHTPFKTPKGTPIQPKGGQGVQGQIELDPAYAEGLDGLDGFSHIILLFYCHQAQPFSLRVKPFLDDEKHGLFATRAPSRPNAIGLSIVELVEIQGTTLMIQNVDMLDGTPLLDIKPYVPAFDERPNARFGWLEKHVHRLDETRDDGRFAGGEANAE